LPNVHVPRRGDAGDVDAGDVDAGDVDAGDRDVGGGHGITDKGGDGHGSSGKGDAGHGGTGDVAVLVRAMMTMPWLECWRPNVGRRDALMGGPTRHTRLLDRYAVLTAMHLPTVAGEGALVDHSIVKVVRLPVIARCNDALME
jgi:hypothetical protein